MKVSKKCFGYSVLISLIIAIIESLYYLSGCDYILFIIFGIITEIFYLIYLYKEKLLSSPLVFSEIYTLCVLLYQLKLVKSYDNLPVISILTIILCMFIWRIVNSYDIKCIKNNMLLYDFSFNLKLGKFKTVIGFIWMISVMFMFLEWFSAGGIPALRADGETFRFLVSINGITHILAIMNKIVAVLSISYLLGKDRIIIGKDWFLIFVFLTSTLLIYLTNMRGELVVIIFTIVVVYYIKKRPKLYKVIILVAPLLLFIGIIPIVRHYGLYGNMYIHDQKAISEYPGLWFLTPLYQTLSDSIRVFGICTQMYPRAYPYGIINYNILPIIPFLDLGKDVSQDIADFTNHHFYSGLTSSYLGPAYADGGIITCVLYTTLFALWGRWLFKKFVQKKTYKYTVLYIYMFYQILMLSYGNIMDLAFFCYYAMICFVCNYAEQEKIIRR